MLQSNFNLDYNMFNLQDMWSMENDSSFFKEAPIFGER